MTVVLSAALRAAAQRLREAGIADAMTDARLLVCAAAGIRREDILRDPDLPLDPPAEARFAAMIGRRAAREPVSRILGRREFRSLDYRLGPATLDPRPDSETLVDHALALCPRGVLRILDIGTGTGCLLLSLLDTLPAATGTGTDIAPDAIRVARDNAAALGLAGRADFVVCEWAGALAGPFDLIVSNPPYIPAADIAALEPEVARYDPRLALDGGTDGLDAYRALAVSVAALLSGRGVAVVEIGAGQAAAVTAVFEAEGWRPLGTGTDLAGRARSLAFGQPSLPGY